jgi:uncharacterized membrane protein YciS (DUF1049 family)
MELIMISCVILALALHAVIGKIINDRKLEKLWNKVDELREEKKLKNVNDETKCDGENLENLDNENDLETEEELEDEEEKIEEEEEIELSELDKEKGKWLMDVSKYILTAFVFTFMVENIQNKVIANLVAAGFALGVFFVGTRYLTTKRQKEKDKKRRKRKILTQKLESHGSSNRLFRYIRCRRRRTDRKK